MNIRKATESYDKWKAARTQIVKPDLEFKHEQMADAAFPFFRATFYRWVQLWEEICPDDAKAPSVLAVGDLHVENFGTWRDLEGRLIWGVNDFDEVYPMAYTNDLVRLAVSAHLAVEAEDLQLSVKDVCDAILDGYREGFAARGKAFVLAEDNKWLRLIALNQLRDPVRFWKRVNALEDFPGNIPSPIREKARGRSAGKRSSLREKAPRRGTRQPGASRACSRSRRGAAAASPEKQKLSRLPRASGRRAARNPKRFCIPTCSLAPSACPILSCISSVHSSCGVSRRIALEFFSPRCPKITTKLAYSRPWDSRPPTFTSARPPRFPPSSAISKLVRAAGCIAPAREC